jgi:predicted nucleic acid-binding protein
MRQAASAMSATAAIMDKPPTLIRLSQSLNLSGFERDLLWLCVAQEFDPSLTALYARIQNNPQQAYPTFALAFSLFENPTWEVLSPQQPLQYWRLLEVHPIQGQPMTTSPLQADRRIVNYIKGVNDFDERLLPLLAPLEVSVDKLSKSQQLQMEAMVAHVKQSFQKQDWPVMQLLGSDQESKQLVASHSAAMLGYGLYHLLAELLPTDATELQTIARLWAREASLLPVALYLDAYDIQESTLDKAASPLNRFLARSSGLIFLDSYDIRSQVKGASLSLQIKKPTPSEQQTAWIEELGTQAPSGAPALLAGQFNLSLREIKQIAQEVPRAAEEYSHQKMLWRASLVYTRPRLEKLAQRIEPKATWRDIVLRPDPFNVMRQITDQVRQRNRVYDQWGFRARMTRGLGILVLFAGQSGTGKTMAAEVLANDLELNLYRIDLSAVVNKYIGETEKNLRALFDAAEDGGAILFFDEADALFGSRSQVRDSHDRYANLEINYLLQRMESFQGLAILATNMKSALDKAFMRRLRFVINFHMPEKEDRKRIWQHIFPAAVPLAELDYERLADFKLSGGHISNIALNAAFQAAHLQRPVTMPYVLNAVRAEFLKLERLINEDDFW